MTKRDVLAVALKVVGVLTFISGLAAIPWAIVMMNVTLTAERTDVTNKPLYVLMSVGAVLIGILVGAYLAKRGDSVARCLERDESVIELTPAEWVRPMFAVALRVVGIVLIARGLPNMVERFAHRYLQYDQLGTSGLEGLSMAFVATNWAELVRELVRIVIGVYLLFGAAGLSGLVMRERREETIEETNA